MEDEWKKSPKDAVVLKFCCSGGWSRRGGRGERHLRLTNRFCSNIQQSSEYHVDVVIFFHSMHWRTIKIAWCLLLYFHFSWASLWVAGLFETKVNWLRAYLFSSKKIAGALWDHHIIRAHGAWSFDLVVALSCSERHEGGKCNRHGCFLNASVETKVRLSVKYALVMSNMTYFTPQERIK